MSTPRSGKKSGRKRNRKGRRRTPKDTEEPETPQRNLADDLAAVDPVQEGQEQGSLQSQTSSRGGKRNVPPTPKTPRTTMPPKQVTIGGITLDTVASAPSGPPAALIQYKKEDRKGMDQSKKAAFFARITTQQHRVFEMQSMTIDSIKDIDGTYNLGNAIEVVRMHFERNDVLDVFNIIFPKLDGDGKPLADLETNADGTTKERFLFSSYGALTAQQVANSCAWYATWPDPVKYEWFQQNLSLSFDYLQNHMDAGLWGKVLEDMHPYQSTRAWGGPLLFFFMMKRLQVNSHVVVESLTNHLKNLRIDQYQGENVERVVSHIRSILNRLRFLDTKNADGTVESNVPKEIRLLILKIMQTSSDESFNAVFKKYEWDRYENWIDAGDQAYGDPEKILLLATTIYSNKLASVEGWNGRFTKENETVFTASGGGSGNSDNNNRCFNCGKVGCSVRNCSLPRNQERIKQNRQTWQQSKRDGKKDRNDTDKKTTQAIKKILKSTEIPTSREKNRIKVHKKWYYWHFNEKKWKLSRVQTDDFNKKYAMLSGTPRVPQGVSGPQPPAATAPTQAHPAQAPAPAPAPASAPGVLYANPQAPMDNTAMTAAVPHIRTQVQTIAHAMNDLINQVNQL